MQPSPMESRYETAGGFTFTSKKMATLDTVDRILRENGISHRHTGVRSPTTSGKIERFHQSLRRELLAHRTFGSLADAQAGLDAWVEHYNTTRPHQALDMATPAERFRLAPITKDNASVPVHEDQERDGQWVLRRVASNGVVSVDNQMFSVGNAYQGETRRRVCAPNAARRTLERCDARPLHRPSLSPL